MNKIQALSILDPKDNTQAALKQAYRQASLKHHPDTGGNTEIMALVNLAYEVLKEILDNNMTWLSGDLWKAKKATPLTETMTILFEKIKFFVGIKVELIGTWLWVSGETRTYKEQLKEYGFKWSKNKTSWYYHEGTYRRRSKKDFDMDAIRGMHGSEELKTESCIAVN